MGLGGHFALKKPVLNLAKGGLGDGFVGFAQKAGPKPDAREPNRKHCSLSTVFATINAE
jgi:hypothetical protein